MRAGRQSLINLISHIESLAIESSQQPCQGDQLSSQCGLRGTITARGRVVVGNRRRSDAAPGVGTHPAWKNAAEEVGTTGT